MSRPRSADCCGSAARRLVSRVLHGDIYIIYTISTATCLYFAVTSGAEINIGIYILLQTCFGFSVQVSVTVSIQKNTKYYVKKKLELYIDICVPKQQSR